jgi:C1A family cysteine protease
MQAMTMFGSLPEPFYKYDVAKFDDEPAAFHYAMAQSFHATKYYRLDPSGTPKQTVLNNVLRSLAAGLPCMFGFTVYSSIGDGPLIPFPGPADEVEGGHAVMAVGYDTTQMGGVLIIRNSWGAEWGDKGYGLLPFTYLTMGLASDFWTLVQADFVDTSVFK